MIPWKTNPYDPLAWSASADQAEEEGRYSEAAILRDNYLRLQEDRKVRLTVSEGLAMDIRRVFREEWKTMDWLEWDRPVPLIGHDDDCLYRPEFTPDPPTLFVGFLHVPLPTSALESKGVYTSAPRMPFVNNLWAEFQITRNHEATLVAVHVGLGDLPQVVKGAV